jgi:hypothetical protein
MKGIVLRVATGGAAVAVWSTLIALPVSAAVIPTVAPVVSVADPASGDYVRRGAMWVSGVACDPNAPASDSTAGIARVAIYLGDRDTAIGVPTYRPGGYFGAATLNGTNPDFSDNTTGLSSRLGLRNPDRSTCKNALAGWRVLTSAIKKGIYEMNVYVQGKNGSETKTTISGLRVDHP